MKFSLKTVAMASVASVLAVAPLFLSANAASAQPTGMTGSYLGGGLSIGVTDGGNDDDEDADLGGNVQGRYDFTQAPVSLRGAWLFGGDSSAIVPSISYDLPVSNNANIYAGVGYSFVTDDGVSQLGDQDTVVLTTGVEGAVARNVVLYGDVKLGLDAYQDSSDAAVSLQVGAGYRF